MVDRFVSAELLNSVEVSNSTARNNSTGGSDGTNKGSSSFSAPLIAIVGILALAFLGVSYYTIMAKFWQWGISGWRRLWRRGGWQSMGGRVINGEAEQLQLGQIGLEEALLQTIPVVDFSRSEKLRLSSDDCAVCLSSFQEADRLRLLPACRHAFHLPCVDAWLRSQANCPLCRTPIAHISHEEEDVNNTNNTDNNSSMALLSHHQHHLISCPASPVSVATSSLRGNRSLQAPEDVSLNQILISGDLKDNISKMMRGELSSTTATETSRSAADQHDGHEEELESDEWWRQRRVDNLSGCCPICLELHKQCRLASVLLFRQHAHSTPCSPSKNFSSPQLPLSSIVPAKKSQPRLHVRSRSYNVGNSSFMLQATTPLASSGSDIHAGRNAAPTAGPSCAINRPHGCLLACWGASAESRDFEASKQVNHVRNTFARSRSLGTTCVTMKRLVSDDALRSLAAQDDGELHQGKSWRRWAAGFQAVSGAAAFKQKQPISNVKLKIPNAFRRSFSAGRLLTI